jgi:hypothetical protein
VNLRSYISDVALAQSLKPIVIRFSLLLLAVVGLSALGCGLIPAPYAINVTGPVRGLRIVDLGSGQDIATASATLEAGLSTTGLSGSMPPQLFASTDEVVEKAEKPKGQKLRRRKDQGFDVPPSVMLGIAALGYTRTNPPAAVLAVSAPGYVHAAIEYCAAEPPQPGWAESRALPQEWAVPHSETAAIATDPKDADGNQELVRCEFHDDGILTFYLRRIGSSGTTNDSQK